MDALRYAEPAGLVVDAETLLDLWHRRASLSETEMGRISVLVRRALHSYYPSELRSLPEDKEELISQFIFSRVLRLDPDHAVSHASPESAPSTAYALCAYFRRYLIDCLRSASHQHNVSIEMDGMAAELDAHTHAIDDPIESVLAEHGLNEVRVRLAARTFIDALDDADRIILAGSLGSRCDRKGGLKRVADEYQVPSYHYRARKLGVTMRKTATSADFTVTKIGCWLIGVLGVAIVMENRDAILVLLNLLALEANA
ncbi:hypothetical protein M0D69_04145 [Caballeronia sp. SEWSISQ10-4 2]|uniref:hypothetical protein n=1 Tax=Caballeronia sp. SEWSISQ10-4 2 TaxID=2937438 RepID=UPI002654EE55|nr:hypothetical protein [Caballeronia sp. SEWSISQ10-4 2]MDN7177213.1 hypothetical protein [Caballeronia sp. SEWSISQ10-4 2]